MHNFRFKRVMRWDRSNQVLRLFRVMWETPTGGVGEKSTKFSVALSPRVFRWLNEGADGWVLTICGLRVSKHHSWGGRYA